MTVTVKLGRPKNLGATVMPQAGTQGTLRGITVQDLTPSLRSQLEVPNGVAGVVIARLAPDSPAAQEGLQPAT